MAGRAAPGTGRRGSTGRASTRSDRSRPISRHRQVGQQERQPGARHSRSRARSRWSGRPGASARPRAADPRPRAAGRRSPRSRRRRVPGGPRPAPRSSCCGPDCSAATTEYGQPGIIWAVPFARPWTWQNSRCGLVSASGRSHGETSAASTIRSPTRGSGSAGHAAAQPGDLDRPVVEPVVEGAVPAAMLRGQRQIHQRPHRPVRAQQRLGQLELRVRPRAQTAVEHLPEPGKITPPSPGPIVVPGRVLRHTAHHGHRLPSSSSVRGTRRGSSGGRSMSRRHAVQAGPAQSAPQDEVKHQAEGTGVCL